VGGAAGATEAIATALLALCEAGDEVVLMEPYYDSYAASVALAGATRRSVVRRAPDFRLDEAELRAAFSDRTRAVVENSPHNPTGTELTPEELQLVVRVAEEHAAVILSDEVYEHLLFSDGPTGGRHVPVATLPGAAERTLTISSAGKTFSVTGWKVGWVHGPAALVDAVRTVKQFVTFVASGPFQPAVAEGLRLPDTFFDGLARGLQGKRDLLCAALREAGLDPMVPDGTYFVLVDGAALGYDDGLALCRDLPRMAGVAAVPVRVFHDDPQAGRSLVRFAFCKKDDVLQEAAERLSRLRRG
jgi:N-succinyldiaminopimelate aminotransferase